MSNTKSSALSPKQARAVELIAAGRTVAEVGALIGVARQTVSGWKNHNSEFSEAVESAREDIIASTRMAGITTHGAILRSLGELALEGKPEDRRKAIELYYRCAVRPEDLDRLNNPLSPEDALIERVIRSEPHGVAE